MEQISGQVRIKYTGGMHQFTAERTLSGFAGSVECLLDFDRGAWHVKARERQHKRRSAR